MTAFAMAGSAASRPEPDRIRWTAGLILAAAAATIAGALAFEHLGGLQPCKLCLVQRDPYYLALPVAVATLLLARRRGARLGLVLLALIFVASAGLGAYHAGVEWGAFAGPSDCGAMGRPLARDVDAFLEQLGQERVTSCTEAAWRFLGLSLAGWNALISLALAALALIGLRPGHGSSSVSQ